MGGVLFDEGKSDLAVGLAVLLFSVVGVLYLGITAVLSFLI